ncbi:MAG: phosphotransferase family protein [Acidobacteriota bacterium]|nr:phosphotransferase family protein [Acidobacteriota bacterium]
MDRPVLLDLTSPVRAGEEVDVAPLSRFLGEPATIEQFPHGHSNLVYLVRTKDREYVMRRPPLGPVAPKAHDMVREFRVLKALNPYFPESPRVWRVCEDSAVIGAPFFLMERRHGVVIRGTAPTRAACEAFIDCYVRLHAIDVTTPEVAALGRPEGFVERQVRGWSERWVRARTEESPRMDRVVSWLGERLPGSGAPTIVHNDFKFDNTMFTPALDRVEAVLDWEMTTLGDPLADIGLTLCYWATEAAGVFSRDEFVERYARKTGRDVSGLAYYEVLGIFKLAVILQQIYLRYRNGQTQDERFRDLDERVRGLIDWAFEKTEGA